MPKEPEDDDLHARAMLGRIRAALTGAEVEVVRVGRFEIAGVLGRGGMGVVYEARDPNLGRVVALKVIDAAAAEARRRVLQEARALARVQHPSIVQVYEAESVGDQVYIAMERVDGRRLDVWIDEQRPGVDAVVAAFGAAGEALAAAHAAGVVHGDFKPHNVLIGAGGADGAGGAVKVVDFGLARIDRASREAASSSRPSPASDASPSPSPSPSAESTPGWTAAGAGTPGYMAPEQRAGVNADERSDQFSFSVALFEALTGRRPFFGRGDLDETALERAPARLRPVLRRGLASAPEERYPSMRALLDALQPAPRRQRRRWPVVAIAGAVVVAAAAVIVVWQTRSGSAATSPARAMTATPPPDAAALAPEVAAPRPSPDAAAPPPSEPIASDRAAAAPAASPVASPAAPVTPTGPVSVAEKTAASVPASSRVMDPDSPEMLASVERMNALKAEEAGKAEPCLRMLDRARELHPGDEGRLAGITRARCEMRLGRCAVGTKRYIEVELANGGAASWVEPEAKRLAENLCLPVDGEVGARVAQLADQARMANGGYHQGQCTPLLPVAEALLADAASLDDADRKLLGKAFASLSFCFIKTASCGEARRARAGNVQLTTGLSSAKADEAAADWAAVECKGAAAAEPDAAPVLPRYEYIPP